MSEPNESMCPKPGHFSWNELVTTNTQAATGFYGKMFGWQAAPFVPPGAPAGGPPYTLFKTNPGDPRGVGGMVQVMQPGAPSQWVPYVVVENADTSLAKAVTLGAKVLLPVMAVGEVGRTNVGIVYNLHHGHDQLERFPGLLARMKSYLVALNLNGMVRDGERLGKKILPLAQGDLDLQLLRIIRDSGWRGPVGILNHTDEDAEARLLDNLDGLEWLGPQLESGTEIWRFKPDGRPAFRGLIFWAGRQAAVDRVLFCAGR
jgi:predicted enzyme related to lactoylglutathione lyase